MASLFSELKRRNVVRVGIAYIVLGWVALQVGDVLFDMFEAPTWVGKSLAALLLLGFPFICLFAWAFELTPEGIKKTAEVDRSDSITHSTGRRLDFIVIGALVVALGYFIWERQAHEPTDHETVVDKSIAVLPFVNMSSDEEQEWFADGLTEEILNALARTPDLLVASRTSSFQYKGKTQDISGIAAALGVAHILEGSVRRGGDRLRVTAQLIRASDGFHLWSETFDREPEDVIEIQENVAIEIANALETAMDPEALKGMVSAGTASVAAYEAYLEGMGQQNISAATGSVENWALAHQAFERAVAIDPGFALAHWNRAIYWRTQVDITTIGAEVSDLPVEVKRAEFDKAIAAAIANEDDAVIRHRYEAFEADYDLRLRDAQRHLEAYIERYANDIEGLGELLSVFAKMRDAEGARPYASRIQKLAHDDPLTLNSVINDLLFVGLVDEAASLAHDVVARYPQHAFLLYQSHRTFLWAGDVENAAILAKTLQTKEFPEENLWIVRLRQACGEGDLAAAETIYSEGLRVASGYSMGYISRLVIGRPDEAHQLLIDAGLDVHTLASFLNYPYFDHTKFPELVDILDRQGIDRPFIKSPPYACKATG